MMQLQVIDSFNMTHEEFYRVNGMLTPSRIDDMLDTLDESKALEDIVSNSAVYAKEARGCFVSEDFAQEHLDDLRDIAKRLRGDNRNSLLMLIDRLEDSVKEAVGNAEYGADELRKIINA